MKSEDILYVCSNKKKLYSMISYVYFFTVAFFQLLACSYVVYYENFSNENGDRLKFICRYYSMQWIF